MTKEIQYSEREKIIRKYGIRQGINDTISTLIIASGPLSALAKYAFDSTPENLTFKERAAYAGLAVIPPIVGWGINEISSKINKYLERRALNKLEKFDSIPFEVINPEKVRSA